MAKQIDPTEVSQLIERGQNAEALMKQLQAQVEKVTKAQEQLTEQLQSLADLLGKEKKAKGRGRGRPKGRAKVAKGGKEARPKPGSAPEQLCKVMSSSKPMQVSEIAEKTKLSEGTVKQYIHKFDCFYLAGRGKGYLCRPSSSAGQMTGPTGMELGQKTKKAKKKATKKSRKKAAGK